MILLRILPLWIYMSFSIITPLVSQSNRVCYASNKLPICSNHTLRCPGPSKIKVFRAKYGYINRTDNPRCLCGRSQCDYCSNESTVQNWVDRCFQPHSDLDYWDLVSKCSFKSHCSVPIPTELKSFHTNRICERVSSSELRPSFSHITYGCFRDNTTVNFCNGKTSGKGLSILYERTSKNLHLYCHCSVTVYGSHNDDNYIIQSLDIRNPSFDGGGHFNLSFTSYNESKNIVNESIEQNQNIFAAPRNQTTLIRLSVDYDLGNPERIWIQIKGRLDATITCDSNVVATTDYTSTTHSSAVTSTTPTSRSHNSASTFEPSLTSTHTAGVQVAQITGGTVGGLIVLIMAAFVIHRRRNTPSEEVNELNESHSNQYNDREGNAMNCVLDNTHPKESNFHDSKDHLSRKESVATHASNNFNRKSQNKNLCYMNVDVCPTDEYSNVDMVSEVLSLPVAYHEAETEEDCYNHLRSRVNTFAVLATDYDTTASASKAVKNLENQDDYYSYDHLGTSTGTTVTE